ncbi:unnamed protein product [Ceratitis capitata]|uniref:(Mediterranean fruit fly) hypothetical protein n=1 Tax=Ceratitis capitata TaxID=7213 RepID=A0A811U409_CERCA|nr:unnamed protein product [Ceratitis capitata]
MIFAMKDCQIQNVYRPAQKREKKPAEGAAFARRCLYVTAIPKLTTTIYISCAKKCKRVPVCAVAVFEFFFILYVCLFHFWQTIQIILGQMCPFAVARAFCRCCCCLTFKAIWILAWQMVDGRYVVVVVVVVVVGVNDDFNELLTR